MNTSPAPRFERYRWAGGEEWITRFGPADGPQVIAALPLFEEANRTRAFVVTILRLLAERGIGGALPELPGQGESLVPTERATVLNMQAAFAAAAETTGSRLPYTLSVRSGALLDAAGVVSGRWRLSPQDGPELLRELTRVKQVKNGRKLDDGLSSERTSYPSTAEPPAEIAGNMIGVDLLTELTVKQPIVPSPDLHHRTVRLAGDPRDADAHVTGSPPWRRAEPDNDVPLAQVLADDIAEWITACEG